ncbi:hypothetical protein [Acanthopleuribacter pedis]|uniref:Uncharacterized protein n=1 Tax=Acanthopleuribacter pedis TaxID=442870 RepID=A0A8J7U4F0_9BACT|nr:hypothetical protein [Acanthopleuribacter pedis]MBO1319363.1 hypothetical protein [Acanthopleuribacter pedis]
MPARRSPRAIQAAKSSTAGVMEQDRAHPGNLFILIELDDAHPTFNRARSWLKSPLSAKVSHAATAPPVPERAFANHRNDHRLPRRNNRAEITFEPKERDKREDFG